MWAIGMIGSSLVQDIWDCDKRHRKHLPRSFKRTSTCFCTGGLRKCRIWREACIAQAVSRMVILYERNFWGQLDSSWRELPRPRCHTHPLVILGMWVCWAYCYRSLTHPIIILTQLAQSVLQVNGPILSHRPTTEGGASEGSPGLRPSAAWHI